MASTELGKGLRWGHRGAAAPAVDYGRGAGLGLTIIMGWMNSISAPHSIGEVYRIPVGDRSFGMPILTESTLPKAYS